MTIYLYTGTPGSGKSLHMAKQIYWTVKRNLPVVCNFEMCFPEDSTFIFKDNSELSFEYLTDFSKEYFRDHKFKEGAIRLYIDECQLIFNARSWNAKDRADWIKFFTQHRKLGYDVYLITQFDTMLDKQLRSLVEYECKHRKLNNYGWVGKLAGIIFVRAPVIVAVNYWYPMKTRLSADWLIGTRKYYRLYDTAKIFS